MQTFSNIYAIAFAIYVVSLGFGMWFYMAVNPWNLSTAYFFATTVLCGNMYLVPTEESSASETFTLCFFLWGSVLMAAAIIALANDLVSTAVRVAADERQRILNMMEPDDFDNDGVVGVGDHVQFYTSKLAYNVGWYEYKSQYVTLFIAILWLGLGVIYGLWFEKWALLQSIYFAIAAVSASGSSPPECIGPDEYDCHIGNARAFLMATYIMVGVPLCAYTIGQFAGMVVEQAVRAKEHQLMTRPLTEAEFVFARQLRKGVLMIPGVNDDERHVEADQNDANTKQKITQADALSLSESVSDSKCSSPPHTPQRDSHTAATVTTATTTTTVGAPSLNIPPSPLSPPTTRNAVDKINVHVNDLSIDLGEFIVLELLRLQKVNINDLLCMKALFDEIDDCGDGVIDMAELARHNKVTRDTTGRYSTKSPIVGNSDKHDYMRVNGDNCGDSGGSDHVERQAGYGALDRTDSVSVAGGGAADSELSNSGKVRCFDALLLAASVKDLCDTDRGSPVSVRTDNGGGSQKHSSGQCRESSTTFSDMYNSLVIPTVAQHIRDSGVSNLWSTGLTADTDNGGDNDENKRNGSVSGDVETGLHNSEKHSPISPFHSRWRSKPRSSTATDFELKPLRNSGFFVSKTAVKAKEAPARVMGCRSSDSLAALLKLPSKVVSSGGGGTRSRSSTTGSSETQHQR